MWENKTTLSLFSLSLFFSSLYPIYYNLYNPFIYGVFSLITLLWNYYYITICEIFLKPLFMGYQLNYTIIKSLLYNYICNFLKPSTHAVLLHSTLTLFIYYHLFIKCLFSWKITFPLIFSHLTNIKSEEFCEVFYDFFSVLKLIKILNIKGGEE